MGEPQFFASLTGTEFQLSDALLIGQVSGLADDRVFAELIRMRPFDGQYRKMILPYAWSFQDAFPAPGAVAPGATVQRSGFANSSVVVYPFRAIVGSRTALNSGTELRNWRDIRSGIYTPVGGVAGTSFALAPNSSAALVPWWPGSGA